MDGNQFGQPTLPYSNGYLGPQSYVPQTFVPQAFVPQLAPQGFFGSLLGGPVGGLIGGGIGGLFGQSSFGRQLGQSLGTIGGGFLPFSVDPTTAAYAQQAYAQQAQLAPQGFFGNLLGQIGQPVGSAIGGLFGNPTLGGQIGGLAGQFGRFLPFSVDPTTLPYAQAYAQQAQLAPQGFFGNLLGQIGQPLGSAVGGLFGNPTLGGQIGGFAGQLGRFLPFQASPFPSPFPTLPFQSTPFQAVPYAAIPYPVQTPPPGVLH